MDDLHFDAQLFEEVHDALGLPLPHEAVLDEHRLEGRSQGAVPEHRDRGRVDASRKGIDRRPAADRGSDLLRLLVNEAFGIEILGADLLYHSMSSLR